MFTPLQRQQDQAARTIQRFARRSLVKNKPEIPPLSKLESYKAMLLGNDPMISGLEKYQAYSGNVAFIGTSVLRSVLLTCQLAGVTKRHFRFPTPQIFLIDNSRQVNLLWSELKAFFSLCTTLECFIIHFQSFFENLMNEELVRCHSLHNVENIKQYFMDELFEKYGFENVRNIILNTYNITQSWTNRETFLEIKKILDRRQIKNVYVYPSNIIPYLYMQLFEQGRREAASAAACSIIRNIEIIDPTVSIITDWCAECTKAENFYLLETPSAINPHLMFSNCNE